MLAILPVPETVAGNPAAALVVFFGLLIAHAICDFPLQGEFLAKGKNRHADLSSIFGNVPVPKGLWINALSAHSLIHAGGVWLVTGSVVLGFIEFVIHFFIDYAKCEEWLSFAADQTLHRVCKLIYAVLLYFGPAWITWSPA